MDSFITMFLKAARTVAIEYHGYVEEDGVLLAPDTIKLVTELEEVNRQCLIDQSLQTGNKEMFMQLTARR